MTWKIILEWSKLGEGIGEKGVPCGELSHTERKRLQGSGEI